MAQEFSSTLSVDLSLPQQVKMREPSWGSRHPSRPLRNTDLTVSSLNLSLSPFHSVLWVCMRISVSQPASLILFSFPTSGTATFCPSQRAPPSPAWSANSFQMCLWNSSTITAETGRKHMALWLLTQAHKADIFLFRHPSTPTGRVAWGLLYPGASTDMLGYSNNTNRSYLLGSKDWTRHAAISISLSPDPELVRYG